MDLYEDNGHNREKLKHIANQYTPPTQKSYKKEKPRTFKQKQEQVILDRHTKDLFDILPFCGVDLNKEEDKLYACIQYIPTISNQLKASLKKAGINTTFTSGTTLKNMLCGKNKTHAPKEKKKGIYKYTCTCSQKSIYIGQTHRSCETRWKEHERAINKQQWHHSGISQHYEHCQEQFKLENFEVVHTMQDKRKNRLAYNLRMREAFEIRSHDSGPGKGLNEDNGAYLKTDIWDPVLKAH